MSYGSLISITHASEDGRTLTVLLEQEAYAGSPYSASVELGLPAYILDFVGDSEINSLGAEVYFVTHDSALIAILQTMRFGDERDGRLTIKVGSAVVFQGYVVPDAVSVPLTEQRTRTITIRAKDRTRSLDEGWLTGGVPYTGDIVASVLIADILASTGIPFTEIRALQTWRPSRLAFSSDPYSIKIPARNFYDYREDGSVVAHSKKWVLEQVLGLTLCELVQWNGVWYIDQPTSHFSAETVTYHLYDASGTHTGTSTFGAYVDLSDSEWLVDSDEGSSAEAYRQAEVTYAISENLNLVINPSFELWGTGAPSAWSGPGFAWKGPDNAGATALAIDGKESATPTSSQATQYLEQAITIDRVVSRLAISLLTGWNVFQLQDNFYRVYTTNDWWISGIVFTAYSVKLVSGASTYYLQTDGSWSVTAEVKHEVLPTQGQLKRTEISADIPPGVGTLTVRLYQAVHPPIRLGNGGDPAVLGLRLAVLWDEITILSDEADEEGASAVTYAVHDSDQVGGARYERTFHIGDGPTPSSFGAIKNPDGTETRNWRPLANATVFYPITELNAREFLRSRRNAQATIAFHLSTANLNVTPVTAYKFGSKRFWPTKMRIEQPSGRAAILAREIRDDGVVGMEAESRRAERIQVSRSTDGAVVYADLSPRIQNALVLIASATTSSVIQAGTRSSIPIIPVDSIFPGGTPITLVDSRTGNSVDLTVSDNYGRFEPILKINSFAFTQNFDVGSYIIISPAHALHRLAITENAHNQTIRAGRICALNGAVAGTVTSLVVTPTRRDLAKDTVLVIVEGLTGSVDVSDDEQTVQASAFVPAGSLVIPIVSQRVDAPDGAHLTEDNQQLWSFFLQNPDKIQLGVERQRTGSNFTSLTAAVSGAAVTSLSVAALESGAKEDDTYEVIHKRTGHTVVVTLSADAAETDTSIAIDAADFSGAGSAFPVGSRVRLSDVTTRSELIILDGFISLLTTTTDGHTTSIAGLEATTTAINAQVVLKAEVTTGKITKLATVALSATVGSGSAITLAADQINIDGTTTFTAGYNPSLRADVQHATTAPTTRADTSALRTGDLWVETDNNNKVWTRTAAAAWAAIDGVTATGVNVTIRATAAPTLRADGTALVAGDFWIETDDGDKPYTWSGSAWVAAYTQIAGGSITTGTINAARISIGSSTTYDAGYNPSTKARTFRQTTAPTADATGDIWIDTDDGNRPYTWSGSAWVAALTVISGGNITTGTIDASVVAVTNLSASNISTGTLSADRIASGSIADTKLGTTVISGGKIITGLLTASNITTGTLNASLVTVTNINASNISTGTLTAIAINNGSGTFQVTTGGALTATSATITGAITATSGSFSGVTISGTLTMGASGSITNTGADYSLTATGLAIAAANAFTAARAINFGGTSAKLWYNSLFPGGGFRIDTSDPVYIGGSAVWTAGNDGAGSGLDADLLDGVQGSAYAALAGTQTFTGNKTFSGQAIFGTVVNMADLPTSSAGLSAGDLWNDANTVKVAG